MTTEALMDLLNAGRLLDPGTPEGVRMNEISSRAREICSLINRESSDVARVVAGNPARPIREVAETPEEAAP